jgi:hypothetical protein
VTPIGEKKTCERSTVLPNIRLFLCLFSWCLFSWYRAPAAAFDFAEVLDLDTDSVVKIGSEKDFVRRQFIYVSHIKKHAKQAVISRSMTLVCAAFCSAK